MITAHYKGVDIELCVRELENGNWTGDFTLTRHKGGTTETVPYSTKYEFSDRETAKRRALEDAQGEIDRLN